MTENNTIIKVNDTEITYLEKGIIHIHYADKIFNLEEAKEIFYKVREHSPWRISPLLISGSLFTNFESDARAFYGTDEVMQHYSGVAFLVESMGQKLSVNFFKHFIRPKSPTKAFKKREEAIQWLSKFETQANDL